MIVFNHFDLIHTDFSCFSPNFTTLESNYHNGWVIDHLLAYVSLWIALLRAQVVPRWSAWLIVVSASVMGLLPGGRDNEF